MYQDYVTTWDVGPRVKRNLSARNAPLHPLQVKDTLIWIFFIMTSQMYAKHGMISKNRYDI